MCFNFLPFFIHAHRHELVYYTPLSVLFLHSLLFLGDLFLSLHIEIPDPFHSCVMFPCKGYLFTLLLDTWVGSHLFFTITHSATVSNLKVYSFICCKVSVGAVPEVKWLG
jgi:hypothetical protein